MSEEIYEKFEKYDWEEDAAFKVSSIPERTIPDEQNGVQKLLDMKNVPHQSTEAQTLIDKYKFFYFSKSLL
jgi:hypothetical protein